MEELDKLRFEMFKQRMRDDILLSQIGVELIVEGKKMEEKKYVKTVRVRLLLKKSQLNSNNCYRYSINNEERISYSEFVEYACISLDSAFNSFKESEVDLFDITSDFMWNI